ncbi:unnamed protein product [Orchesella dallaii]|uniref:Protein zer-1 n=1 Tax=Orchesella dallaii TaxID=48710 RepID=A0ABP1QEY7_9HEXA
MIPFFSSETPQGLRKIVRSITNLFNGKSVTDEDRKTHGLLTTPKLKRLVVWGLHVSQLQQLRINNVSSQERVGEGDINANAVHVDYWEYLTRDFIHELQHLDVSSCQEITDLSFLLKAKDSLKSLYLHDVLLDYDDKTWGILKHLNGLQFLDVSQYNELASVFPNPDAILDGIVTVLPHLVGLDISGTNLAGMYYFLIQTGFEPDGLMPCGIMGLKSRKQTPLKFLGLLTTHYNASCRRNIPATNIAGGNHMEHLLIALQCYLKRENTIKKVIRMLYEKVQVTSDDTFLPAHTILRFLVQAVKNHVHDKHTQIVAMAVMYHVLRRIYQGPTKLLGKVQRDQVMYCISKAMKVHSHDFSLLRNGMLNILLLTPYINMRPYMEDITPVLLEVGKAASADSFMMKAVAYILYNLTRSLPKTEKESLGDIEIVEKLCAIVDDLLRNESLDQMLIFWTLLWNITDDLPSNCERFVKAKGIEICFRYVSICLDGLAKPESNCGPVPADLHEAQIPMFALLSNLLQHSSFATKIIKPEYITNVFNLLEKEDSADNEKLLFHTCGFLCNVVSKELSSSLEAPTRQEILDRILHITKRLDFKKQFDYDFRYLIPLTSLLEVKDAPEIHVWVLWTLVNLTETNPNKYTSLVASDERLKKWLQTDRFNLPYENKCSAENLRLSEILLTRLGTGTPKQS